MIQSTITSFKRKSETVRFGNVILAMFVSLASFLQASNVVSNDNNPVFELNRTSNNPTNLNIKENGTFVGQISAGVDEGLDISSVGARDINFWTNGTERFSIGSSGRLSLFRHLDATGTWGAGSRKSMFLGWYSDKIILGNGDDGGHDFALNTDDDAIIATNPFYAYGKVGIGTNAPDFKLSVHENNNQWVGQIRNFHSSGYGLFIRAGATDGSTESLKIQNQADSPMLVIKGNGKIGVGTDAPSDTFTVNGKITSLADGGGEGGHFVLRAHSGYTKKYHLDNNKDDFRLFAENDNGGGAEVFMTIKPSGKIGIGTSTPGDKDKLTVNGRITSLRDADEGGQLSLSAQSGYSKKFSLDNKEDSFRLMSENESGGGGIVLMNATADGKIGIGTSTFAPGAKLAVNGKIFTKEIIVTQENWPDYVFEKDYDLPRLEDVEKHIKAHKHLPAVPTASEVEANGVGVGEMSKILLQKVEELTLYTIELQKQNQELTKRLDRLEKLR